MKRIKRTEDLIGLTLISYKLNDDSLSLSFSDGNEVVYYHNQDCCEDVWIEDINGDFDRLLNQPLLVAECVTNADGERPEYCSESYTWTFYKFSTNLDSVTVRWLGQSNGYYSEEVDMMVNGKNVYQVVEL